MSRSIQQWQKNLQLIALIVATAALPFSIFLCHTAIGLFLLLWLLEGSWAQKIQIVRGSILLQCIIGLFFIQFVGTAYSEYKSAGWSELGKKALLVVVPVAIATTSNSLTLKQVRILLTVFVSTCIMAALVCVANAGVEILNVNFGQADQLDLANGRISYLHSAFSDARFIPREWLYFSYVSLASAIHIHPAYLSLYIAFSIVVILFEVVSSNSLSTTKQILFVGTALFLSIFEVFLATRVVIIALLLLIFSGSVYLLFKRNKLRLSLVGFLIMIVAIAVLRINPVSYYRNVQEIAKSNFAIGANSFYKTSAEIRASLWWLAWKAYGNTNPLVGSGTGSAKAKIKEQSDRYRVTNVLDSYDPHNQFLYFLIDNGIVGLLAFVTCLFIPLGISIIEKDFLFLGFGILCCALFMTESALELQKGIAFVAIMYSLLAFQRRSYQFHPLKLNPFSVRH